MGRLRHQSIMATKPGVRRERLTLTQLSAYDDILTDTLVDHVWFWTIIRKNRAKYNQIRGVNEDDVTRILLHDVVIGNDCARAEAHLLQMPGLKRYCESLKTPWERADFRRHMRRYIGIWMCDCPFEVTTTNRFTITGHEASVTARRRIRAGEVIKYLNGHLVAMTQEEEEDMDLTKRDFSVVLSSRKKTPLFFLGPARFANHDCDANARLLTQGSDGMIVMADRDIAVDTEITVNYGDQYFGEDNCECLCATCELRQAGRWAVQSSQNEESIVVGTSNHPSKQTFYGPDAWNPPMSTSDLACESAKVSGNEAERSEFLSSNVGSLGMEDQDVSIHGDDADKVSLLDDLDNPDAPLSKANTAGSETSTSTSEDLKANDSANDSPQEQAPSNSVLVDREGRIDNGGNEQSSALVLQSLDNFFDQAMRRRSLNINNCLSTWPNFVPYGVKCGKPILSCPGHDSEQGNSSTVSTAISTPIFGWKGRPHRWKRRTMLSVSKQKNWPTLLGKSKRDNLDQKPLDHTLDANYAKRKRMSNLENDIRKRRRTFNFGAKEDESHMDQAWHRRHSLDNVKSKTGALSSSCNRKSSDAGGVQTGEGHAMPRIPGDHVRTPLLLTTCLSRWVDCYTCSNWWVESGRQTRKECPRCERHSKLYGFQWPKTENAVGEDDERVLDHRTVHRFLTRIEEKQRPRRQKGLLSIDMHDESNFHHSHDGSLNVLTTSLQASRPHDRALRDRSSLGILRTLS